jgi:hypothetical protein
MRIAQFYRQSADCADAQPVAQVPGVQRKSNDASMLRDANKSAFTARRGPVRDSTLRARSPRGSAD